MAKYLHYISVPVTARLTLAVESDDRELDEDALSELADDYIMSADPTTRLTMTERVDGQLRDHRTFTIDEWEHHKHLNRGNVCYAVCPEISIDDTEEL